MATEAARPVPRPRRTVAAAVSVEEDQQADQNKNYVNVALSVDQSDISRGSSSSKSSSSAPSPVDEVDRQNNNNNVDLRNPYNGVLLEIDKLSIEQQQESESNNNKPDKPKPAPRNRTRQPHQGQQYENTEIRMTKPCQRVPQPEIMISSATGAIKKQPTRVAPPRPPSPKILNNRSPPSDVKYSPEQMKRSSSTNTLDSSQDGSETSSRYKTSSPGHILKSIGMSGKLLTEAITERVSKNTKGARKKIVKTSKETLFTLSSDATSTLKNVRDKINTRMSNMNLGRTTSKDEMELDRPITLPPDSDNAFKGIQFNSPLNNKAKTSYDLTDATYETPKKRYSLRTNDGSELSIECPSYEEAVKSNSTLNESFSPLPNEFERNTGVTQSMMSCIGERPVLLEKSKFKPLARHKSDTNLSSPELEIPCPNFPPPILSLSPVYGTINKRAVTISSDEEDDPVQLSPIPPPPIRHKAKQKRQQQQKVEEKVEEEEVVVDEEEKVRVCSNRATVDPNEFKRENRIYPRLDASKLLPEKETSKCDSWSFYDAVAKDQILSPTKSVAKFTVTQQQKIPEVRTEQSYENVEPVYGAVFSGTGKGGAQNVENILLEFDPLIGSGSLDDQGGNGKSNHLLLLETLLSQETYGTIDDEDHNTGNTSEDDSLDIVEDDYVPMPPSRQESLPQAEPRPTASVTVNKKEKPEDKESHKRPVMIVHQNWNLRSDSMENIVDEAEMDRYLAHTDEIANQSTTTAEGSALEPLPEPSSSLFYINQNRPHSLIPESPQPTQSNNDPLANSKLNKLEDKESVPAEPPPSYQDVLKEKALQDVPTTKTDTPNSPTTTNTPKKSSMMSRFSNVFNRSVNRKSSLKSSSKPDVKTLLEMVPRPQGAILPIDYEGHLVRYPTGVVEDILKEIQFRHTAIKNHTFYTFLNSEHKNPKESFPLEDVTTVQSIVNQKMTNGQTDIHCFEVTVEVPKSHSQSAQVNSNPNMVLTATNSGNCKATRVCHVYGCVKQSERSVWMQKILENMTNAFPKTATQDYKRAGWCYMKNSISASWSGAWLLLQRRKLLFYYEGRLDVLDLRKARCIVLKETDDSINNLRVEAGPILMIDCPPFTLYLIMNWPRETKIWRNIIREMAHNNGMTLKSQQLTKDNVPVLVDKCINFIYTHGSMSEGIYRKSGSENQVAKMLTSFREDAFGVQLTRTEYSEHDVASALKRFMRELPEPLLGKYTVSFLAVSNLQNTKDKLLSYAELLQRLPIIEHQTLRKLLGHLNFIQSQKAKNKMGTDNLAMLWGPTLMADKQADQMKYSQAEATVMADLIGYYKQLFHPTNEELEKEMIMLTVLQKYHAAAENLSDAVKQSGDLKVWIIVELGAGEEENLQVSVTLTPTKTVHDVLRELRTKIKTEPYQCTLNEVILDGTLERPLHYTEKVLDTVLRWTYWVDADRKTNCLKIKSNKFLLDVQRALKTMSSVIPVDELKFADVKSKAIKLSTLELNNGSVNVLKREKSGEIKNVKAIELKTTIAFLGCEKKRESNARWGITLMDAGFQKRTRESPFIGHLVAGDNFNNQTIWYACILHALYGDDLMPSPEIL